MRRHCLVLLKNHSTRLRAQWAEADCLVAIPLERDVCPRALVTGKRPDPAGIIAAIRQQHCLWAQFAQENRAKLIVMRLAGREANTLISLPLSGAQPTWRDMLVAASRSKMTRSGNRIDPHRPQPCAPEFSVLDDLFSIGSDARQCLTRVVHS